MPVNFIPSNPGTDTEIRYRSVLKKDGQIELVKDGERALFEEIQSHRDECDINNIMRRYLAGDVNALGSVQGFYADITSLPQTRHEALQAMLDAEKAFSELPVDIRLKFDNNWQTFFIEAGSSGFAEKLGLSDPSKIVLEPEKDIKE